MLPYAFFFGPADIHPTEQPLLIINDGETAVQIEEIYLEGDMDGCMAVQPPIEQPITVYPFEQLKVELVRVAPCQEGSQASVCVAAGDLHACASIHHARAASPPPSKL